MSTQPELLAVHAVNLTIDIAIDADVASTWKAMIEDVGQWWRADFCICKGSTMAMDARVGGMMYEKLPDGAGFAWGNLISFQPNKHLAYVTYVIPPWAGPAQSVVQIALAENPDGSTLLTLTDSLIGHLTEEHLASTKDGWRLLYGEGGLKSFIESS